jgi:FO synthase subunit 2
LISNFHSTPSSLIQTIEPILDRARAGGDLSAAEGILLLEQKDPEAIALIKNTADLLRQKQAGETVTYVINRNLNFTNICEQHCNFCAFRRDREEEGAFWLNATQIREKVTDAIRRQATEICMQGGLNTEAKIEGSSLKYYGKLVENVKTEVPQIHLHAFSPQEIQFIAREDGLSYRETISSLKAAGVDSMPGTAAEILDDRVRKIICPEKIDTETWVEIVSTAHSLGVPTTSTILSGHIETPVQQIEHLARLRSMQQKAIANNYRAKFTEFIILPFVGEQAPLALRKRVGRNQPILEDTLLLTAVARIFLGNWIGNHQPSWVKLGLEGAVRALQWGCNDIGGTLMEEHITTMAGAIGGTCMEVTTLQKAIAAINRPYRQRDTLYGLI